MTCFDESLLFRVIYMGTLFSLQIFCNITILYLYMYVNVCSIILLRFRVNYVPALLSLLKFIYIISILYACMFENIMAIRLIYS